MVPRSSTDPTIFRFPGIIPLSYSECQHRKLDPNYPNIFMPTLQITSERELCSLVIPEVFKEDAGNFMVKATNQAGTAKCYASLIVKASSDKHVMKTRYLRHSSMSSMEMLFCYVLLTMRFLQTGWGFSYICERNNPWTQGSWICQALQWCQGSSRTAIQVWDHCDWLTKA